MPRNFYFVNLKDPADRIDPERLYWAETDPEQALLAKPPYDDVKMKGHIEGSFLFLTALSKNLLPFALTDPKLVALPIVMSDGHLRICKVSDLRADGYRGMAKWMEEAEKIWTVKRRKKASKQTVVSVA